PEAPSRSESSSNGTTGSTEEQDRVVRILGRLLDRAITEGDNPFQSSGRELLAPVAAVRSAGGSPGQQKASICILKNTNGRVGGPDGAAARMGLKRTTLITRMKKLGIEARRVF